MKVHLGIDAGTSKISLVAVDVESDKIKAVFSLPNDANITNLQKKGYSEQDPIRIRNITFELLRKLVRSNEIPADKIRAIGLTGQMHGLLILDKKNNPLTNLITWQDQRCSENFPGEVYDYVREMVEIVGEDNFYNTGCFPATGYMGSTLFWLKNNQLLPKRKFKVSFIHDWLASLLAENEIIYTDPTDAASSGIFDIINKSWNFKIIEKLNLPLEILPKIRLSGEIISETTSSTEREIGLPAGIPICCPIGDNQASILGSLFSILPPENYKHAVLVNIGTGAQVSTVIEKFLRLKDIDTRPFMNNLYILVGASLSGGQAYSLLEKFFKEVGLLFWGIKDKKSLFEAMNKSAEQVGEGDTLICEPFFFGSRAEPTKLASFKNISKKNMTPAHFTRAVLEGIVNELYELYISMSKLHFQHKIIVCSGNAVKKNPLLRKLIAEKFNLPIKLTQHNEEAAYGATRIINI